MRLKLISLLLAVSLARSIYADADPWELVDPSLWLRNFTGSETDEGIALPTEDLEKEGIGKKYSVMGLFDHWDLTDKAAGGRTIQYAEVTQECKGKIEPEYALTAEQWADPSERRKHFDALDKLMEKIGSTLLVDFKEVMTKEDRAMLLLSFHALAWQETHWENYIRYKDWFFVVLSGGSYNKLEDWGISQVARSSKDPANLLNRGFFERKGYCSIGSTLYYGFLEFYFHIKAAKKLPCNEGRLEQIILGAYNQYATGFSSCYNSFSDDPKFRNYQMRAQAGYRNAMDNKPWKEE